MQKAIVLLFYYIVLVLLSFGCKQDHTDPYVAIDPDETSVTHTFLPLPETVLSPDDNSTTPQKVKLGKLLFFDPILSGNKDVACATCHHPEFGYAEFRDISIGVNGTGMSSKRIFNTPNDIPFVKRNAHTILNTAYNGMTKEGNYNPKKAPMFWDSRSNNLEEQALEPIKSLEEMRGRKYDEDNILPEILRRLKNIPEYQKLFKVAFEGEDVITQENLSKAIAAFERTLVTSNSRFDRYLKGDKNALSISEKEGFELFKKVGCANCHSGPMLSDFKMHVLSVTQNEKLKKIDSGFNNQFAFRTPTLRNLRYTAPYMHNGNLKDLKKVLEFYEDISKGKSKNPDIPDQLMDSLVKKITLKAIDIGPIISFLNTLNGTDFDQKIVTSVPSGLPVGGNIQ